MSVFMQAKVCHFYGWNLKDVESMPYKKFMQYWNAITPIEAQQSLVDLKISVYPELKPPKQKKIFNEFKRLAYNTIKKKTDGKLATMDSILNSLARQVNGR